MPYIDLLKKRRSYYNIGRDITLQDQELEDMIGQIVHYSPSAFNSQSTRVLLLLGDKHEAFWNGTEEILKAKTKKDFSETQAKMKSFRDGYGTVLFFEEMDTVHGLEEQFPSYAANFLPWSDQANAMVQIGVWLALRDKEIGASLQHYNPIVDKMVQETFKVPENYRLVAQMPFGSIKEEPEAKDKKDLSERFRVEK